MTRLSPSRTSTVLRSLAAMSLTICSRSRTSMGLLEGGGPAGVSPGASAFGRFRLSLNVAALEGPVEVGQRLAAGVGNEDIVLDADAPFAGEVDTGLDGDDHARP